MSYLFGHQTIHGGMVTSHGKWSFGATVRLPLYTSMSLQRPKPHDLALSDETMDLPPRELGSYLRMTVGGRDVPTYALRRSPTNNWGFVMESCWGIFASFELPPKLEISSTRECDMQDASLNISNDLQWREAFLYNVGSRVLPEGDEATDEFDRAWRGI